MARQLNLFSAKGVQALKVPGRHADGGGLYLAVEPSGSKRWVMRYRFGGKRHDLGFGSAGAVPLARARELAAAVRAALARGENPIESRRAAAREAAPPAPITFGDVATSYMADREATWRNAKHRAQ